MSAIGVVAAVAGGLALLALVAWLVRSRSRVADAVIVTPAGSTVLGGGKGRLQIDVRRRPHPAQGRATLHVEVEVANFYPSIASRLGTPLYKLTQSRIHVLITHGFLRSLARLDLAESKVGRFATTSTASARLEDVPDPP